MDESAMNEDGKSEGPPQEREERTLPLGDVGKLVELLAESGVGEIRVRQGELEITIKAKTKAPADHPAMSYTPPPLESVSPAETEAEGVVERDGALHIVCSPLVGTFYRAPRPGEEPYAEVGDLVEEGQTLCLVEAMKLMNEIPADVSGELVEVLVENAKGVEYGQPLFHIRPEG